MARTALTIIGGLVGAYFGYPQLGMAVGSLVGNAVDPQKIQGPRIGETGAQTSAEGAPRAIVYGTAHVTGNVIVSGPLIKGEVEAEGGKGGPVQTNEIAIRTYAIRICEGPIRSVLRIWEDDKLVYDMREGSGIIAESLQWAFGTGIYLGTEDQLPDSFLNANVPPYDHPAHRGTAYMVFVGRDLTDRRGSIPQYRFEVSTTTSAVTPGAGWFDYAPFFGTGGFVSFETLDLSEGGLVWVVRQDASEPVRMYFKLPLASDVWEMGNSTIVGGPPPDNPVISDAIFQATGMVYLPASTNGASYIAYVFKVDAGNFNIFTYAGNGTAGRTVAHGLGSVPKMHFLRQFDDPSATIGYMHIDYFNGLSHLQITSGANVAESTQQWNDTAPDATNITLGSHGQVNGSGRLYVMFAFGGADMVTNGSNAGVDITTGFEPTFAWAKRRTSGSDSYNYNLITGSGQLGFDGSENMGFGSESGGVAYVENRINKVAAGLYDFSTAGGVGGDWTARFVDSIFIKGQSVPDPDVITLGEIVADINDRCQIITAEYDVDELTDVVAGLVLAGDYTGGDAIDSLRSTYFFDKAEYEKKLWFPKRGKAVVDTLTIDDLTEIPDLSRREQTLEFPKKMHLQFQHAASGYVTVKATSARSSQDARVVGEVMSQTPVVLNEDQAAQTVAKMHKVAWTEADGEFQLSVPESMLAIVPSDCLGVSLRGVVNRYRVEKQQHEAGMLKWTLRRDRQSAYTSDVTGIPIPEPTPPPPSIVGETVLVVAEISPRQDSEDDLHYLVAVTGANPAWYGAVVQRSLDGGASFTQAARITSAARIGELLNVVPDADEHTTDTTNSVQIRLYRDTHSLDSITDSEFLSEGGAFLLENADGTFEVMQYRDAETDSAGDITLSMLHRGRLNSGTSSHAIGAKFVMLEDMTHVVAQSAWIGQTLTHRAPSFEQSAELAATQDMPFLGTSQIEWPVASLTLSRVGDVVDAFWVPRHRLGTDDAPVASINFQGYRVTITGTGTITFDQTADSFSQDVSSIGGSVTVTVQALNRITGAGPATSGTI